SRCAADSPTKRSRAEATRLLRGRRGGTGRAVPALLVCLFVTGCRGHRPPEEPKDYAATIAADRAAKDAAFAATDDPIPKARHAEFLPLAYYPIDPDYHVPAAFKPIADPAIVEMP